MQGLIRAIMDDHKKLNEIDERIIELRGRIESPRSSIISDMPRGGGTGKGIEDSLAVIEKLQAKRVFYSDRIVSQWHVIENMLKYCSTSKKYITLMEYRLLHGLTWKSCVKAMKKEYPDEKWNENKNFRIYGQIMQKLKKYIEKK